MTSATCTTKSDGVTLMPDGRLVQSLWKYDHAARKGEFVRKDVTERADEFLFDLLTLHPQALVRSLFLLLQAAPALLKVFRRAYASELLLEALGPEPTYDIGGGISTDEVEFTAVYRSLSRHSADRTVSGVTGLQFHGVGFVQKEDLLEHGHVTCKAGNRVYYGFSLTCVRHLLDLPLRYDTELVITEEDSTVEKFWEKSEKLACEELELGEFIRGVLHELSWHGAGEEREAFVNELRETAAGIDAGTVKTYPADEVLDRLKARIDAHKAP